MNGGMELYLHMPFCVRKCAYCDFLSFTTDQETQNLYTRRLREDIDAMGKKYGDIPVETIFIGGAGFSADRRDHGICAEGVSCGGRRGDLYGGEPWNRDKGETHRLQAGRDQSPKLRTPIGK